MKRFVVMGVSGVVALCALLVGVVLAVRPVSDSSPPAAATSVSSLESAALPDAAHVEPPATIADARFSRAVFAATTMPGSGVMLDVCRGPVAIDLGDSYPLLVAEHDYCGGSAWIPKLEKGDGVDLTGQGVEPGLYEVTAIRYGQRRKARFSDMPTTAVVLQTCISETQIVLVGLEPVDEAAV